MRAEGTNGGWNDNGERRAHRQGHADFFRNIQHAEEFVKHRHNQRPTTDAKNARQNTGHRTRSRQRADEKENFVEIVTGEHGAPAG